MGESCYLPELGGQMHRYCGLWQSKHIAACRCAKLAAASEM